MTTTWNMAINTSGYQLGLILPFKGHVPKSGNIFGCIIVGEGYCWHLEARVYRGQGYY